jgi:hypothetical protein
MGLKFPLSCSELGQPSLGTFAGAALETGAPAHEMGADLFDRLAGVGFAVAVGCDVDDAEVDAEHIGRLDQRGIIDVAHAREVPLIPHNHQVDLAVAEQSLLVLAGHAGDFLPTANRPNRDGVVVNEAENAVIVGMGGKAAERALRCPIALIGIGHVSYAAHGGLRRQVEHLACVAVSQLAQIELSEFARLPSLGREKVARLITTLKRLAKQFLLLWRGKY